MKYSNNVSMIFSESPRRLYRIGLIVFLMVIICAACYLYFVRYDNRYEFEFLVNTEKNTGLSFASDCSLNQLKNYTLMVETTNSSLETSENSILASTRISEKQLSYLMESQEDDLTLCFEKGDGGFTADISGSIVKKGDGILILRINYSTTNNDFLKGRYFVNYRLKGKILFKDVPFITNVL